MDGKEPFNIVALNWFDLVKQIDKFMKINSEISFPLGEDDNMKIVTKKATDCEVFKK